jgi:hypothetical protein
MPVAERPRTSLAVPSSISENDWNAVCWQIYFEMIWVSKVQWWFGTKVDNLITKSAITNGATLENLAAMVEISPNSTTAIVLDILAMLAGAVAAILGGPAGFVVAGAVAGCMGAVFSGAAGLIPGASDPITVEYDNLRLTLENKFTAANDENGKVQLAITGGVDSDTYLTADFGLLRQIGQDVSDTTWAWPEESDPELTAARAYALYVFQHLLAAKPWVVRCSGFGPPDDFPSQYIYSTAPHYDDEYFLSIDTGTDTDSTPGSLSDLFDPQVDGQVFPMGVPLTDVYLGLNGWPSLPQTLGVACAPPYGAAALPTGFSARPDVHLRVALSRDPNTQHILATITLHNRGLKTATNCELTAANLGVRTSLDKLPMHPMQIRKGHPQSVIVRFPALAAGQKAVLRLSGRYQGGTFGGSFRVTLP